MDSEEKIQGQESTSTDNTTQNQSTESIDAGEQILSWDTWDSIPVERGRMWYVVFVGIGALLMTYALLTTNPLFALIVLMIGVMMLVNSTRKAKQISVHITTGGIVVGDKFHPYDELKDFSIIYKPPYSTILYIDFKAWLTPLQGVELANVDPVAVREALLPVLPENLEREDELLTDLAKKVYKL